MNKKTLETTIQLLRVFFAIPLSLIAIKYLELSNAAIRIVFFMGIYILVAVLIEIFLRLIKKK